MTPVATLAHTAGARIERTSLRGALALGALLGLVWSPCSGPLLGSALALAASDGDAGRGALILGVFGIGAATPLVAVAYASRASFSRLRGWVMGSAVVVKRVFGGVLMAVGVAILTGVDKRIEAQVNNWLPEAWLALLTRF